MVVNLKLVREGPGSSFHSLLLELNILLTSLTREILVSVPT